MKILKSVLKYLTIGIIFGLWFGVFLFSSYDYTPKYKEVKSSSYTISEKKAVRQSVNSVVAVFSISDDSAQLSTLSGTYFEFAGEYYVLTSAHGILGGCTRIVAAHLDEQSSCEEIRVINRELDYAIFKVEEMEFLAPPNSNFL